MGVMGRFQFSGKPFNADQFLDEIVKARPDLGSKLTLEYTDTTVWVTAEDLEESFIRDMWNRHVPNVDWRKTQDQIFLEQGLFSLQGRVFSSLTTTEKDTLLLLLLIERGWADSLGRIKEI